MGTSIELTIEGVTLDWSKNSMGTDHGVLFQIGDRTRRRSDQIDYDYYADHPEEDIAAHEACFARPLAKVLPRLNLLGHTLETAKQEYLAAIEFRNELDDMMERPAKSYFDFDEFCQLACRRPLIGLDQNVDHDDKGGIAAAFGIEESELDRLPAGLDRDFFWSEPSYLSANVCLLSAYSMLQVFGTSEANAGAEIIWQFGPIVDAGYVDIEAFQPGPGRTQRTLIATEGSSDAHIIQHALRLLEPDITDFFRFIDVSERHPFSGTGSLVKFAEGLVKIDVQNRILFLLDNDAEGVEAFQKISQLNMPMNMKAMVLPDHETFRSFPARGPEGLMNSDINRRAAAIECYLDLDMPGCNPAEICWSNYKRDSDAWHGALEFKETYMRRFLAQTRNDIDTGKYDISKMECVTRALIESTTSLAMGIYQGPSQGYDP